MFHVGWTREKKSVQLLARAESSKGALHGNAVALVAVATGLKPLRAELEGNESGSFRLYGRYHPRPHGGHGKHGQSHALPLGARLTKST